MSSLIQWIMFLCCVDIYAVSGSMCGTVGYSANGWYITSYPNTASCGWHQNTECRSECSSGPIFYTSCCPTYCEPCPENHFCPSSVYTYTTKQPCKSCPVGYYYWKQCTRCEDAEIAECTTEGYYCNGDGYQRPCTSCPFGKVTLTSCTRTKDTQCVDCPSYMYIPSNITGNSYSDCLCNPGTTGNYTAGCKTCTKFCSNGYIDKDKPCTSTRDTVCQTCPSNSVVKINGTSYLDCYCKAGYYGRVTGPTTSNCQPCPPNKFCPGIYNRVCPCSKSESSA